MTKQKTKNTITKKEYLQFWKDFTPEDLEQKALLKDVLEIHRILGRDGYKIDDTYIIDKKNNKTILDVIEDHLSKDFNIYATRSA